MAMNVNSPLTVPLRGQPLHVLVFGAVPSIAEPSSACPCLASHTPLQIHAPLQSHPMPVFVRLAPGWYSHPIISRHSQPDARPPSSFAAKACATPTTASERGGAAEAAAAEELERSFSPLSAPTQIPQRTTP